VHLFAYGQRTFVEWLRRCKVALRVEQVGEGVEALCRMGMLGAEHLFAYGQRTFVEWPRRCKVALRVEHDGEVVEALCRKGMLGAEHLLAYCKDITNNRHSLGVSCAAVQVDDRPVQEVGPVMSETASERASRSASRCGVS
jgi:hypothetical protein